MDRNHLLNPPKILLTAGGIVAAATLGLAAGGATAEPETITVTETVEVEVTPQSCLDALDDSDTALSIAGDGFAVLSTAFDAAAHLDMATLEASGSDLAALTPQLQDALDDYAATSTRCRDGATA